MAQTTLPPQSFSALGGIVPGTVSTDTVGEGVRHSNLRERILRMTLGGNLPIQALAMIGKNKSRGMFMIQDPEFAYEYTLAAIWRSQVNGQKTAGVSTITVDSPDPSNANAGIPFGKARHLVAGDILRVENENPRNVEYLVVTDTPVNDTDIKVTRGALGSQAAAIPDNSWLSRIGNAFAENTGAPPAVHSIPLAVQQYCQIIKHSAEASRTAIETEMRLGGNLMKRLLSEAYDNHVKDVELACIFGKRSKRTVNNLPLRTMDGFIQQVPSGNVFVKDKADQTWTKIMADMQNLFNYHSEADNTRMIYGGNGFITKMNEIVNDVSNLRVVQKDTFGKEYGWNLTELIVPRGRFLMKEHPLLSANARDTNMALVIDPSTIVWHCHGSADMRLDENQQLPDIDGEKHTYVSECAMTLDLGGHTNGVFVFKP